jgi:hypothetical protein
MNAERVLPGRRLLAFASHWFDPAVVARVLEPLVADWQREWREAPPARRPWIRARGVLCFAIAVTAMTPRALLAPTPPPLLRRIVARLITFLIVASTIMSLPFLFELRRVAPGRLAVLLFWLLPAGLALVFPFATGYIVDGIRRHRTPSPAERMAAVRTALAAAVFMLLFVGWVVPATNQQFRLTVKADPWNPPARGFRELTTYQLFAGTGPQALADPARTREASRLREQHQRASFLVLPIVLIWLRWRALDHASPRWLLPPGLAATAALGTYFGLRWNDQAIENLLGAGPGFGAWVPIAAFICIGIVRNRVARVTSWT